MLLSAFLTVFVAKADAAQDVYDRMRTILDRASSISVQADYPPDDFHTWSFNIAFLRPASASVGDYTIVFRTNGKWTYFYDTGAIQHRPSNKSDLTRWRHFIGLESFFDPARRPTVIGPVKRVALPRGASRTSLALDLKFADADYATLYVDGETSLPLGFAYQNQGFVAYNDLKLDAQINSELFAVRPPPTAAAVYAESQRRLKNIQTLRLQKSRDGRADEEILFSRPNLLRRRIEGRTVAASNGKQKYWAWDNPPKHVWQMTDLLGFESLTGSTLRPVFSGKVEASSWLGDCWLLNMRIPGSKKQFKLLVGRSEKSLLPLGYVVIEGDKVLQLVEYRWLATNESLNKREFVMPRHSGVR